MPVINLLSLSSKSTLHCLLYENRDGPCNISALQLAQCLAMMEKGAGGMLKKEGLSFLVSGFTPPSCSCFIAARALVGTLRGAVELSCTLWAGSHQISEVLSWSDSHQVLESQCLTSILASCTQVGYSCLPSDCEQLLDEPTTTPSTVRSESQLRRGGATLPNLFLPWEPSSSPATFFKLLYILLCNWDFFLLELVIFYLKLPGFKILCCLCPFTDLNWYIKLGKSNFNFWVQ